MAAVFAASGLTLLVACAPAASPSPTAAPAKPAATTAPAAQPTAAAKPAESKPAEAKPAASPAAAAKPTEAAKPAEKAAPKPLSRNRAVVATVSNSWTVMMTPLAALEKGYWKEYGLDAEVKVVGPGATHVAAVIGGSIDYSVNLNTEGIARANAKGDKIYGISGSTNKPNYALFAKGVNSVAELKGKSIATDTPGGAAETVAIQILEGKGLKVSDVTLVPVAGTIEERTRAMLTGATAAAIGSVSDWPTLRPQGVVQLATLEEVAPDYQFALNASRGEMLERYADTTVAFLKGMIKGYQFIHDSKNDAEITQILKKHDIRVDDANFKELLSIQRPLMTKDGGLNRKGLEVVVQPLIDRKEVPADYKVDQLLRLEFLQQAQKELGINP
jgi:NitT/TauT family transport system substrate-binding protein